MLSLEYLAELFDIGGKLLVSFTAIMVHHRFLKEHKVDKKVFKTMRNERGLGILGILAMLIAFLIKTMLHFS